MLRNRDSKISDKIAYCVATSFGTGYSPVWPGTVGALVGIALAAIVSPLHPAMQALACAVVFVAGVWSSERVCRHSGKGDPQIVVVDETFGTMATLCVLPPEPLWWVAGFVAFRFFDIVKPWPIRLMHERGHGGTGVMLDDAAAAIYAGGVLLTLSWIVSG